jgi:hypothetical protein
MSTLGSLMLALADPGIKPYNEQELTENRIRFGNTQNQTQLLELAEMKRQQETAARMRQALQANPGLVLGEGGGGPLLASPALTAGGGPMTQQTVQRGAGVPPQDGGPIPPEMAAQVTPTVTPPGGPQSTIGGLAPQPRQDPLAAIFRTDPDAGLKLLDMRTKRQEQQLQWGLKSIEAVAQISQGVTNQDSLDQAREYMQQIAPQAAARLPKVYTKEGMEAFQAQALRVKERQTLKIQDLAAQAEAVKAQATLLKQQQAGANIPNYTGDANLDAAIYERMKGQAPGAIPPADVVAAARKDVQEGKVTVSERQGAAQAQSRAMGETMQKRLEAFDKAGMAGQETHTVLDEAERLIAEGVYSNSPIDRANMLAYNKGLAPGDTKAQRTKRLMELGAQLKLAHGSLGSGVSVADAVTYGKAAGNFEEPKNLAEMQQSITSMRTIANTAMRRANEARKSAETTGKLPEFEERGNKVFSEADIAATMKGSGKTRQQVIEAAKAKGYTVH